MRRHLIDAVSKACLMMLIGTHAFAQTLPAQTVDLALLPFDNRSGRVELDWMQRGLPRVLHRDVARARVASVAPSSRTEAAVQSAKKSSASFSKEQLMALGRSLSVSQVITGRIDRGGARSFVNLKLEIISTLTGRVLAKTRGRTPIDDPLPAARRLLADLLTRAQFDAVNEQVLSVVSPPPRAVIEALDTAIQLTSSDSSRARSEFARVTREDPVSARQAIELVEAFPDVNPAVMIFPVAAQRIDADVDALLVHKALTSDLDKLGVMAPKSAVNIAYRNAWTPEQMAEEGQRHQAELVLTLESTMIENRCRLRTQLITSSTGRVAATFVEEGPSLPATLAMAERTLGDILTLPYALHRGKLLSSVRSKDALVAALKTQENEAKSRDAMQPRIVRFESIPTAAGAGAGVLAWQAEHVDSCLLEGVGVVPLQGRRMMTSSSSDTFRLICEADGQTVEATASVIYGSSWAWKPAVFWSAFATAGVGMALTVGGFIFAVYPAAEANQLHGLTLALQDGDERNGLRALRDEKALAANIGVGLALVGVVLLVGGVGTLGATQLLE